MKNLKTSLWICAVLTSFLVGVSLANFHNAQLRKPEVSIVPRIPEVCKIEPEKPRPATLEFSLNGYVEIYHLAAGTNHHLIVDENRIIGMVEQPRATKASIIPGIPESTVAEVSR